jgi:hypothetical protein
MAEQILIIGMVPAEYSDEVFVIGDCYKKISLQLIENENNPLITEVYVIEHSGISEKGRNILVSGKDWWNEKSTLWDFVEKLLKSVTGNKYPCMSTSELVAGWEIMQEETEASGGFQRLYDDEGTGEFLNSDGRFNGYFFLYLANLQDESKATEDYEPDERIIVFLKQSP